VKKFVWLGIVGLLCATIFVSQRLWSETNMKKLTQQWQQVLQSTTAEKETANIEQFQQWTRQNKINYELSVADGSGKKIPIIDLTNHMKEKLSVTLTIVGGSAQQAWQPKSNSNILPLLRE